MLTQLIRIAKRLKTSSPTIQFQDPLPFWCPETENFESEIVQQVKSYTQTSPARIAALCQAVAHIERMEISGAVVECGVWKGGSMMAVATTLLRLGTTKRPLYLYDTFSGMPVPDEIDRDFQGRSAYSMMTEAGFEADMVRAYCCQEEVRSALTQTRYPSEKLVFVPGLVEDTLPKHAPDRIALLRLDTDWYASTRHELEMLYPRLEEGGVLIIDDYGHWQGARRAVDEYFAKQKIKVKLHAIDYTGRLMIKKQEARSA